MLTWRQMADGESSFSGPLDPEDLVHTTFQTLFPHGYHSLLPVRKHRVRTAASTLLSLHALHQSPRCLPACGSAEAATCKHACGRRLQTSAMPMHWQSQPDGWTPAAGVRGWTLCPGIGAWVQAAAWSVQ